MWNEAKQTLTRFHLQYRRQLFKPTDVSACPVGYNKLGPQRRTTMYFEDGSSKEVVDDWHHGDQQTPRRWKGRTEFQMAMDTYPWEKGGQGREENTTPEEEEEEVEKKYGQKREAEDEEEVREGLEKRARTEKEEGPEEEEEVHRGRARPLEEDEESPGQSSNDDASDEKAKRTK